MPETRIEEGRGLASLTSWKIGGPAAYFAEPEDVGTLQWCLEWAARRSLPVLPLGGGSNLLVADEGFPGLVLRYSDSSSARDDSGDEMRVRFGARFPLARAARMLASEGWAGLEWAEGIPGTIGGAVVGNAGAFGGEIAQTLREVDTFSLEAGSRILTAAECGFSYRMSVFKTPGGLAGQGGPSVFVIAASFTLHRSDPAELAARMHAITEQRRERTPVGMSCGSVFRNPPGTSAGRLIDQVGLKGARRGGAQISPLHGNYIVNLGGASARDVLELIVLARETVRRELGVELELEVRLAGVTA